MPTVLDLSPNEIIETLKRSTLKTVLVEGKDDIIFYRKMEEEFSSNNIDFIQCGGKSTLLKVYEKRSEIKLTMLFICDSDRWMFIPKPENLGNDIICTEGYSIENEIYQDGKEHLHKLFDEDELEKISKIIKSVCEWFAFEIKKILNDCDHDCKFSDVTLLNRSILPDYSYSLSQSFLKQRSFTPPDQELFEKIYNDYSIYLRGKYIFQIFIKIFQERKKDCVKYEKSQLFDIILRNTNDRNDYIMVRRKNEIKSFFNI